MISKTKYKQTEIGEIPNDWNLVELKEVLADKGYIRGPFGSALRRPELKTHGIPVYEQQHAIYNIRDFRYYIDEKKFEELKRFQVKTNDLIISCSGTLGKVSIILSDDPKGIISQALLTLRPDPNKILPHFLKYFFTSKNGFSSITSRSSGSVQVNIANRQIIESIMFPLPGVIEQQAIIFVLSSLDNMIELKLRMKRTLEEMSKALFKRWFVDFEFPNENGKPYKANGGKMMDSELGQVPEGWNVSTIGEYITILDAKRIPLSSREREKRKGEYRYYGATGIMDYVDDFLFKGVYLLLGEDGTVTREGGLPYTQYVWGKFWVNNHAHVLQGKEPFTTEFVKLFFDSTIVSSYITGAVQPKLNQSNLRSIPFLVPKKSIVEQFSPVIKDIYAQIRANEEEVDTLIKIKDSVLPRLICGKLRVN